MPLTEIVAGVSLLMLSILGYQNSFLVVNETQKVITGSMTWLFPSNFTGSQSHLILQMGNSEIQTMTKIAHYGFGVLVLLGLVFVAYGILSKKRIANQFNVLL